MGIGEKEPNFERKFKLSSIEENPFLHSSFALNRLSYIRFRKLTRKGLPWWMNYKYDREQDEVKIVTAPPGKSLYQLAQGKKVKLKDIARICIECIGLLMWYHFEHRMV